VGRIAAPVASDPAPGAATLELVSPSLGALAHELHDRAQRDPQFERAKDLLATRAVSVTDIGLTVGFSETSAFSTAFRKATGLAPTRYGRAFA